MSQSRSCVEAHLSQAEARLQAAEAKFKEKTKGRLKSHPLWRKEQGEVKKYRSRLKAIDKLEARDASLKAEAASE